MLIDKSFEMSAGQAVTASAASTNVIDLGKSGKFAANPFYLCCRAAEAAAASGAATVTVEIQSSDNEDFSSGVTTHFSSGAVGKANITKGRHLFMVNVGEMKFGRYVRGYYTVATGPLTAGKFDLYGSAAVDMK